MANKSFIFSILIVFFTLVSPAKSNADFNFGAAGDFDDARGVSEPHDSSPVRIALEFYQDELDFFIGLGDLSYDNNEQTWCSEFIEQFPNFLFVVGNHDTTLEHEATDGGDLSDFQQYCPYPLTNVPYVLYNDTSYGEQYYFDYPVDIPLARFILIPPGMPSHTTDQAWLADVIDSAKVQGMWVIVGMHMNYVSTGTHGCGYGDEIETEIWDLLLEKKVDLILQGHDHTYQRSHSLTYARCSEFDNAWVADNGSDNTYNRCVGSVVVIQGTGGRDNGSVNSDETEAGYFAAIDGTTCGFVKYTVTPTRITTEFIATPQERINGSCAGTFTDSFTIEEQGDLLDCDDDGLSDSDEALLGTNPTDPDSDDDNFEDGTEVSRGWDPLDATDPRGKMMTVLTNYLFDDSSSTFCAPPNSGTDWTITRDCTLSSSQTWSGNLYIQNDAVMTIPSGILLNLDFSQKKLVVESGSGVLIEQGGRVY